MADEFDDLALGMTIRGYAAGQRLFGRFVLKRILGRGGMGMVWLAWDERLEREVALKFLPDLLRSDAAALDDLKRETRRGLDLAHPHIVRVYDLVEDPNAAAIAMEFVDGQTLAAMRVAKEGKVFDVAEISVWVRQLCEALDYAHHRAKLVHRDLKPANLMINAQEDLKVTDFGIARSISDSVSRVTMDRGTSGTLLYMSPQQALGQKPAISDDVYAIGATLYELLTSKPPFHSGNIARQLEETTPPPMVDRRAELELTGPPIPPAWEDTVAACLSKDPTKRPVGAMDVASRMGLLSGPISFAGSSTSLAGKSAARTVTGQTDRVPAGTKPGLEAATTPPASGGGKRGGLIAVIAALLALGAAGYYFYQQKGSAAADTAKTEQAEKARLEQERLAAEKAKTDSTQSAEEKRKQDEAARAAETARLAEIKRKQDEARRAAAPQTFVVPDQYNRIQLAMDAAKAGDTIQVKPGSYVESILFKDGVRLIGTDANACRIEALEVPGREEMILVRGCKSGSIEKLTLLGGGILVDGILIADSRIVVTDCIIADCKGSGIVVRGEGSSPTLTRNQCRGNARQGIWFLTRSVGLAESNVSSANGVTGISVSDPGTDPVLRKNECRENKKHGIEFSYGSGGTAEENICERNGSGGIVIVNTGTSPTMRRNQSRGNLQTGMAFGNGSGGLAENNVSEGNAGSGIVIYDKGTNPTLRGNESRTNKLHGFEYQRGSIGVLEGNTSEANDGCGVIISDPQTEPTVRDNRLLNNKQFGILIVNGATPKIDASNKITGNKMGPTSRR
jgi:nitrous oxidase accessory protein NosD